MAMKYGYARVSSKAQDHAAQIEALKAAGCERIYSEKMSAKSTDGRREFEKLMRALVPGDTVVVTKLDRLARSSRDLHNIIHELDGLGCGFVSLREGWCDTTTSAGRLMMTIMGGIAQFERELIRSRCEEGIERAKRKGTKFGRPTRLDDGEKRKIAERYAAGETIEQLAEEYECGVGTVWRALQPEITAAA
jgi:DNA invertase Pin-like site-specific DNA recombinase